jgi:hypothetical protein
MANNYPNLRPSFNADFVNGIYVDPRITFTRAGTRTFFDEDMVKAEENLLLQSQTFDNASWVKLNVSITANAAVAPDGTTTAETLTHTSAAGDLAQSFVFLAVPYTYTFFIKYVDNQWVRLSIFNSLAWFDVQNGVIGTTTAATSAITSVGSGWYRCTITATPAAGSNSFGICNVSADGSNTRTVTSCTIWGAQVEQRSFATAYTATTTQPITNYQRLLKTAAANEWPREFDPVTGECLGRSVWESRTNLLLRSEDLSTTWANEESTESVNVAIAPDGTLTADLLIPNTNNVSHWIGQTVTATAVSHTFSFFAKAFGYSVVQVLNSNSGSAFINFDLSTGLVGSSSTYTGTMTSIGNGWYRCTATATLSAASAAWARVAIVPASTSARAAAFAGDGFSGVLLWGAQLEAGAFATPYIPTVASQITRLADSAVMTGVNFSSWFNPEQGCLFIDSSTPSGATRNRAAIISDGTSSNVIINEINTSSNISGFVAVSGSTQAGFGGTPTAGINYKQALSYKFNDFAFCRDGGAVSSDTTGTVPVVNQLGIGVLGAGTPGNGYIKRLTYYNQAFTAANLQAVTR